ncbi:hypothetical protein SZ64_04770 [Erythrobacter sp. SG61-1L]|uniref:surface-adhesin E family protein n=1 Tax=Erythrobacter sp. SG61-1L TaxID=1603897 RepID=UPI0006C8F6A8|nr:surface-adhesin E family protein [Erythrobacter sp. SG61-1L]KPL67475.1 hypothetical protein SZ64_04770 [Erythrobacter sp. SG61-1L]
MRASFLIGLTASTFLTTPAMAEAWNEVGVSDAVIVYADVDSIQNVGSNKTMMVFQGFDLGMGTSGKAYYTKSQIELDCTNHKVRELRMDAYGMDHAMLAPEPLDTAWQTFADGTIGAAYNAVACNGERADMSYSDPFAAADEYWEYMYYYGE